MFCPPTGALAVVMFCMPTAPAAKPFAVIASHVISAVAGVAVATYLPDDFAATFLPATHVALALAALAMLQFKVLNPPAAAYAAAVAGKSLSLKAAITGPGVLGALVLIAAQAAWNAIPFPASPKKKSA